MTEFEEQNSQTEKSLKKVLTKGRESGKIIKLSDGGESIRKKGIDKGAGAVV